MQISLPGTADVAAATASSIAKAAANGGLAKSYFSDGQAAPYSGIGYFGTVSVTGPLAEQEIASLRQGLAQETAQMKQHQQRRKKAGEKASFAVLPTPGWEGAAWDFGDAIYGRLFRAQQYYGWRISVEPEEAAYLGAAFKSLMAGLLPRRNFAMPSAIGVCLPYFFVGDAGTVDRRVATTYRLKDHPDVTVVMEDASASEIATFQNPDKFTVKSKTNYFWTQLYQSPISRKSLSSDTITFAGQKGLETKLKLGREDGSDDFGYSVFTRGDPEATRDTPDLMLVLIRNAADAKAKGRNPISEDAFFALAKSIAASVKARPVTK